MSETPFFPEPPPFGLPTPLQPKSEQDASEHALPAMEKDYARARAREEAYGGIYTRYRERLLRLVRTYLKAADRAEDLLHDVMLGALKNDLTGRCGHDDECIGSYLMVATKNRVFDEFRDLGREREARRGLTAWLLTRVIPVDLTSRRAETRDIERHVNRIIWKLPLRCREVFIARRILDMKPPEIATRLGVSVKTVKVQLTKAHWLFRKELAAIGYYYMPEHQGEEEDAP